MLIFLATGAIDGCDAGSELPEGFVLGNGFVATAVGSWVSLTFRVGDEKVNPDALK